MATYDALRDRALNQVGCAGQTEAQTVCQIAIEEAMKFVAFHVRVTSLIAEATATAGASPDLESNAITIETAGFSISSGTFQMPDRLYVKTSTSVVEKGTPYEFMEYHHFQDLKNIPAGMRVGVMDPASLDERPQYCWTITPSTKVWATPLAQGNVLTLVYRKNPAAYVGANTPEISPMFDHILVNAGVIAVKEWLREPDQITDLWTLFEQALMPQVQRYDLFLNSQRKRSHLQIHRSYRPL